MSWTLQWLQLFWEEHFRFLQRYPVQLRFFFFCSCGSFVMNKKVHIPARILRWCRLLPTAMLTSFPNIYKTWIHCLQRVKYLPSWKYPRKKFVLAAVPCLLKNDYNWNSSGWAETLPFTLCCRQSGTTGQVQTQLLWTETINVAWYTPENLSWISVPNNAPAMQHYWNEPNL